MDRLESMGLLIAVVEAGSQAAGAKRLRMPLATLSRKIIELETYLNARLLNRSSRKVNLTEAGEAYVAACRRILGEIEDAERAAGGEYKAAKGQLVITAPVVFGRVFLTPVVAAFLMEYPDIDIRLELHERVVNLQEERVDLAARLGNLPDSTLLGAKIGDIKRITCASPDYLKRRGTPLQPAELAGHDCIGFTPFGAISGWDFAVGSAVQHYPQRFRLVVSNAQAAADAAIAGLGVAQLFSSQVMEALASGQLVAILQDFAPAPLPMQLVYPAGRTMPLKLRAFLDFAAPRLRASLTGGRAI